MKFKTDNQSETDFFIECLEIAEDHYKRHYDEAFAQGEEGADMAYCESRKNQARRWIKQLEASDTSSQDLSLSDLSPDLILPQQELRAKIAVQLLPWHLGRISNEYDGEHKGKWDQEAAKRAVRTADALIEELQKSETARYNDLKND